MPSKKYPKGFLPEIYGMYGFKEIGKVPFSEDIFLSGHSQQEYDQLLSYWRSTGWDESKGFPDVVVMKWTGDDSERAGAARRILQADFEGFGVRDWVNLPSQKGNEAFLEQGVQSTSGAGGVSGGDIRRGDTGSVPTSNAARLTDRARTNLGALDALNTNEQGKPWHCGGQIMAKAAVKRVAQAEIRAAKKFLERRGLKSDDVSPRKFAMAGKRTGQGFC